MPLQMVQMFHPTGWLGTLERAIPFLPTEDLPGLLAELDIPVIYARQYLKRHVIQEGTQAPIRSGAKKQSRLYCAVAQKKYLLEV